MNDERVVPKMEGKANFSRRLKQFDGLTWQTLPPPPYFTTYLRHWCSSVGYITIRFQWPWLVNFFWRISTIMLVWF